MGPPPDDAHAQDAQKHKADAFPQTVTPPPSAPEGDASSPGARQRPQTAGARPSSARAARSQVSAACDSCRKKKSKCDGRRPCAACVARSFTCEYATNEGESQTQALKRRFNEMVQSHDTYADLFSMIRGRSRQDAVEIVRRIQAGDSPDELVKYLKIDHLGHSTQDPRRLAMDAFLVNLAHSSASLREIARFANHALDPGTTVGVPNPREFLVFRNRVVHLSRMEKVLRHVGQTEDSGLALIRNGDRRSSGEMLPRTLENSAGPSSEAREDRHKEDHAPYKVPAFPWTNITTSDEAISHLVSLFLTWINPTWRFVEADLFLRGIRSSYLESDFCSPLLVNAICAIASLQSEDDVAFLGGGRERIFRGQHFHDEALRLWSLEHERPTLTNMQALCVLSLDSNYRAKDKLGLSLVPIAARLNNQTSFDPDQNRRAPDVSERDWTRSRVSTHWSVVITNLIMRIAFLSGQPTEPHPSIPPMIDAVFDDRIEFWVGYPLTTARVSHRPTLYLRERCRLAVLFQDVHDLAFGRNEQDNESMRSYAKAVDSLLGKLSAWYQYLPFELHYAWPMCCAVIELHASYLAFRMVLCLVARTRFRETTDLEATPAPPTKLDEEHASFRLIQARDKLKEAIKLSHQAAQLLCDFRSRYGLKITPAWLLQLQAVTGSVLVLDQDLMEPGPDASPISKKANTNRIMDSHAAFDEVFRGLLGTGVQVMIARGIARMMYRVALEQKISLSTSTRSLLQLMADAAWQPSDIALLNSAFPNFATEKGFHDSERMTDILSRWERLEI